MIFVHQMLSLLRLILKFTGKLGVLDHGQLRCAYKLVLVEVEHVNFDGPNL